MKKVILMLITLGMLTSASAISANDVSYAGFGDLTTQEQAEIIKIVADKKAAAQELKNIPVIENVETAQKWVNLGSSIGKGLASSAKELGVTVNEFSQTSVGKWTMVLIVYNIIGDDIIHFFGGMLFLTFGIIFTTVILNRRYGWEITYKDGQETKKERTEMDGESGAWFWFAYLVIIGVSIVIMVAG